MESIYCTVIFECKPEEGGGENNRLTIPEVIKVKAGYIIDQGPPTIFVRGAEFF